MPTSSRGWARHLLGEQIEFYCAGIEAHGLSPDAVRIMAEASVDTSDHRSKLVSDLRGVDFGCNGNTMEELGAGGLLGPVVLYDENP